MRTLHEMHKTITRLSVYLFSEILLLRIYIKSCVTTVVSVHVKFLKKKKKKKRSWYTKSIHNENVDLCILFQTFLDMVNI
jgi:hypothetical protein